MLRTFKVVELLACASSCTMLVEVITDKRKPFDSTGVPLRAPVERVVVKEVQYTGISKSILELATKQPDKPQTSKRQDWCVYTKRRRDVLRHTVMRFSLSTTTTIDRASNFPAQAAMATCDLELDLSPRQLCDTELICNGGFSPLEGFMSEEDYKSVVETNRLSNGLLFGLPVVYDTDREDIEPGKCLGVLGCPARNSSRRVWNHVLGVIDTMSNPRRWYVYPPQDGLCS